MSILIFFTEENALLRPVEPAWTNTVDVSMADFVITKLDNYPM